MTDIKIITHVLNAHGQLSRIEKRIDLAIRLLQKRLSNFITDTSNLKELNFDSLYTIDLIIRSGKSVIKETGMGGYCPYPNEIQITIDPNNKNIKDSRFYDNFGATLAHEWHHSIRSSTVGYGQTLFESLISEGLACHFEQELGYRQPIYVNHLVSYSRQMLIQEMKAIWHDNSYDHASWFFGNTDLNIPKWAGYDIGYWLVNKYLQSTVNTAFNCFDMPSKMFQPVAKSYHAK